MTELKLDTTPRQPKEYWIDPRAGYFDFMLGGNRMAAQDVPRKDFVHVIERSTYERLERDHEYGLKVNKEMRDLIEQERARSAALLDALKEYAQMETKYESNTVADFMYEGESIADKAIRAYEEG